MLYTEKCAIWTMLCTETYAIWTMIYTEKYAIWTMIMKYHAVTKHNLCLHFYHVKYSLFV